MAEEAIFALNAELAVFDAGRDDDAAAFIGAESCQSTLK
jgi:hypothetical protein